MQPADVCDSFFSSLVVNFSVAMFSKLKVNKNSGIPKFIQVANEIVGLIDEGEIVAGQLLPSINVAYKELNVSRDTLINAYKHLQERGLITSWHGKGFRVNQQDTRTHMRILLLFDAMNSFKEILYRSFTETLWATCQADIFFHYYNRDVFRSVVEQSLGNYGYYVLMPHFNEDTSDVVKNIPPGKLLLIDNTIPALEGNYAAIYQDFDQGTYRSLESAASLFSKYQSFKILSSSRFQFIPRGILDATERFAHKHGLQTNSPLIVSIDKINRGDSVLVFRDNDLVELIKKAHTKGWKIGHDIGILSYDNTPLKEVLEGGISVITTDFTAMGQQAARMIMDRSTEKIINPTFFIQRQSL